MTDESNREKQIFEQAFDLESAEEQQRFLQAACGDDAALFARVQVLIHASKVADEFLPETPQGHPPEHLLTEKAGDRIGRYKLLQQIGEGGCGVVYMAEQEEPVRRRVALKVIKLGMDTKQVIARFEAERQALALMDHPNIAKVLDAGATDTGRPYFVMELVRGVKVTDFCDEQNLSTAERLKLIVQICQAIQHAHQKGVIHRDIKPSNILVTVNDGTPVPKVIDFGIAKVTQGRLTDKTLFTAFEQFIGTPAYMSPEQAVMTSLDIDTRSDIYSLGVLLYELLVGCTPFDQKELLAAGLDEMRRTIREKEPPKPSTRLVTMVAGELTTTARHRRTEPPKLIHVVRGDLDWIVMKCLEKDRGRRYETASGVAADIQRHLDKEPVIARPPSRFYRLQKSVQRNRAAFLAGGAVVTALALGLLVATWALVRERAARREAEASGNQARAEAARNAEINKFFVNAPGPGTWRGHDTTLVRAMLDELSRRAGNELSKQPEAQGDIWVFIASRVAGMNDYPRAITNLQQAVEAYGRAYTNTQPRMARTLAMLGKMQSLNNELLVGKANALQGVAMARKCNDPETLAACLLDAAQSFRNSERFEPEAIPLLREALHLSREVVPNFLAGIESTRLLAKALASDGKRDEAKALAQEALALAPSDKDLQEFLRGLESDGERTSGD